jgi:hypothetical protein
MPVQDQLYHTEVFTQEESFNLHWTLLVCLFAIELYREEKEEIT